MLSTLPDAHRISARPNPAPLTATRANDVVEMQPQRPHPLAARRASKPRPRAAVRKPPQTDADVLLDVAELNKELRRLGRDDAQSPAGARLKRPSIPVSTSMTRGSGSCDMGAILAGGLDRPP